MSLLTPSQIQSLETEALVSGPSPLLRARNTALRTGIWTRNQQFGSRWAMGCVALEITQRCNLDCKLCYLSDHSEAVRDIPMGEIFRRIDLIERHYGKGTDVQITGGDPTLRKRSELVDIVERVRVKGLRPTLMTNGIRASRDLLTALKQAGLLDVAFHVDTTQNRTGCHSESDLNVIRETYIDRTRGLGLSVFFNTTIHMGNLCEIPMLVRFFRSHSDVVSLASFQLQADTGRGVWRQRNAVVSMDTVAKQIETGAETQVSFDSVHIGHPKCSRFSMCLAVNGKLFDLLSNQDLVAKIQDSTAHIEWDRANPSRTLMNFAKWLIGHPGIAARVLLEILARLPGMSRDLVASCFRVRKLSFIIHDFMDSCALDPERIDACVFKNMTGDGPLSMCLFNAKRDEYLLNPVAIKEGETERYWHPLDGRLHDTRPKKAIPDPAQIPVKQLKGRRRRDWSETRSRNQMDGRRSSVK